MMHGVNWGGVGAWAGVALSIISAIGYAYARDYRHSLYFAFAAAITLCVIWK